MITQINTKELCKNYPFRGLCLYLICKNNLHQNIHGISVISGKFNKTKRNIMQVYTTFNPTIYNVPSSIAKGLRSTMLLYRRGAE